MSSSKPAPRKRSRIEHLLYAAESLETRLLFTVVPGPSQPIPWRVYDDFGYYTDSRKAKRQTHVRAPTTGHAKATAPTTGQSIAAAPVTEQISAAAAVGSAFSAPVDPGMSTDISPSWKFALNPSGSPAQTTYNDSNWTTVNLPYTWDSTATNNPVLGDGWYRKTVTIPASMVGDEIYLQFQGASLSAAVYVDGTLVGNHNGGWETFGIDVTPEMTAGSHLIAVDVNNSTNASVEPAGGGDYNKEGGLYRKVSLLAVSPTHVALTEPVLSTDPSGSILGGSGVYFSNSTVVMGAASCTIQVGTVLDNSSASASPALTVTSYLVDASGIIQAQSTSSVSALNANQKDDTVTQTATVTNPHLWDGLADPYLYDLYVEVSNTATGQTPGCEPPAGRHSLILGQFPNGLFSQRPVLQARRR